MSKKLGDLTGVVNTVSVIGETARIRLESDEIILKFAIDKEGVRFETSTGNDAPDSLKGLVRSILIVCSKSEGVKELMGLARKLTR